MNRSTLRARSTITYLILTTATAGCSGDPEDDSSLDDGSTGGSDSASSGGNGMSASGGAPAGGSSSTGGGAGSPGESPQPTTTSEVGEYPIADTAQTSCYDSLTGVEDTCKPGEDGHVPGSPLDYSVTLADDGKAYVTDNVTGLVWQQSSDRNGDGAVDANDKQSQADAASYCSDLEESGFSDWRLPTIKELYSLILFTGTDVSGAPGGTDAGAEFDYDLSQYTPFVDQDSFDLALGDTSAGERIIDGQYNSSTIYVSETSLRSNVGMRTMFGVNFVDGRIKGYPSEPSNATYHTRCVRGNEHYGLNNFEDNDDGTVSDRATGLMWQQGDATSTGFDDALAVCDSLDLAGYDDWRLPNIKELHSIVDYSRSPETSSGAALDPVFEATSFTNENGDEDWGYYWSGTTHLDHQGRGRTAAYISFGRALGYTDAAILDVHGAGAQRSNEKDASQLSAGGTPSATGAGGTFYYKGPQGDILRVDNMVRCVRIEADN